MWLDDRAETAQQWAREPIGAIRRVKNAPAMRALRACRNDARAMDRYA